MGVASGVVPDGSTVVAAAQLEAARPGQAPMIKVFLTTMAQIADSLMKIQIEDEAEYESEHLEYVYETEPERPASLGERLR